MEKKRN